ncbi:Fatty-acid amide hydrolase 2 [Geodia barretti]|uniref:Fatty-acid amide hydrolase 2 n=1 Tax=Geodia barretti TaxID=519541 RepID=A0AA35TWJ6_GEOBA|nr:Fatty-acid amide hydrolase 2 [Geodia barretti]
MDNIIYASAKSMAQAVRDKEVSAVELVEAHLGRIEEVNSALNAVVQLAAERARAEAVEADAALARGESKGALHGVPFTLKDSIDTEGIITTGGTLGRKDFVPDADATVTARLRAAGGILLGKTNTPELTYAGETDNLVYGRTNNPFDLSRAPGGSSGGAGAIVCCGGAAFDIGSDTGGSVRGPAHYCGITGIKPNSGRVPRTGHIVPHSFGAVDSLTQNGPMARYVEDLALILSIISGPDWDDPHIVPMPLGNPADVDISGLRVAFYTDNGLRVPTDEIVAAVRSAANALEDAGCLVEEDLPRAIPDNPDINNQLSQGDGQAGARRLLAKYGTTETHEWMTRLLEKASENMVSVGEYTAALEQVDAYRSAMLGFMENYDVIVCPVSAFAALPHGESMTDENRSGINYTATYNITGWPSTVVRGGTSPDGLPIGVQVVARPWREDVSLAVAQYLEGALGGWQRPPM